MDDQLTDSFSDNSTQQSPQSNYPGQFPSSLVGGFSPHTQNPVAQESVPELSVPDWKPAGFFDTPSSKFLNEQQTPQNFTEQNQYSEDQQKLEDSNQDQDQSMPKVSSFIQTNESSNSNWFQNSPIPNETLIRKQNTPPSVSTQSMHSFGGASNFVAPVTQNFSNAPTPNPTTQFTPPTFTQVQDLVPAVPDFFSSPNFASPLPPEPAPVLPVEDNRNFIPEVSVSVPETDLEKKDFSFLTPGSPLELPTQSQTTSTVAEIEISKIKPNPYQPRKYFEPTALQELADSIRIHGIVQPIVVTKNEDHFEIVVGERRFRASQLAGLTKVPAIVKIGMADQAKLEVALIENIQRQELNPIEEAKGYERLIKSFNLTQDQVAKKVGKSRSSVANTLRLLQLPEVIQVGVSEGRITEGHARAMLTVDGPESQVELYSQTLHQGLNVRQIETKAKEMVAKKGFDLIGPDPHVTALENELRTKFGTQVRIQKQGRGGKITIEFFSDEELDALVHRIKEQTENPIDTKPNQGYFTV